MGHEASVQLVLYIAGVLGDTSDTSDPSTALETKPMNAMTMQRFMIRVAFADDASGQPILDGETFLDTVEDPLFEEFEGMVTPAVRDGYGELYCDVEAETREEAVSRVVRTLYSISFLPPSKPEAYPFRELATA